MVGALLGGLISPSDLNKSSVSEVSSRQQASHSRTWVVIHSLGENPCRKVNVYHVGTNGYYLDNRPVEVHALLGADGTVSKVYPSETYLDGSTDDALNAAEQIRFTPATKDGVPISVWLDVRYCGWRPGHARMAKTLDGEDWRVIDE
jgi:hypothetical protein